MNPLLLERLLLHLQFPRVAAWRDPGVSERLLARVQSTRGMVQPVKAKPLGDGAGLEVAPPNNWAKSQPNNVAAPASTQDATPENTFDDAPALEDAFADVVAQHEGAATEADTTAQQKFLGEQEKNTQQNPEKGTEKNTEKNTSKNTGKNSAKNSAKNLEQINQTKPENVSPNQTPQPQTDDALSSTHDGVFATDANAQPPKAPISSEPSLRGVDSGKMALSEMDSSVPAPRKTNLQETNPSEASAPRVALVQPSDPAHLDVVPLDAVRSDAASSSLPVVLATKNTPDNAPSDSQQTPTENTQPNTAHTIKNTAPTQAGEPKPKNDTGQVSQAKMTAQTELLGQVAEAAVPVVVQDGRAVDSTNEHQTRKNQDLQARPANGLQPSTTNPNNPITGNPAPKNINTNTNTETSSAKLETPKATEALVNPDLMPVMVVQDGSAPPSNTLDAQPSPNESQTPNNNANHLEPGGAAHPLGLVDATALQADTAQQNATQNNTVQNNTVQNNTVQNNTVQNNVPSVLTTTPQHAFETTQETAGLVQHPRDASQNPTPQPNPSAPNISASNTVARLAPLTDAARAASQPTPANNPDTTVSKAATPNTAPPETLDGATQNAAVLSDAANVFSQTRLGSTVEVYNPPSARVSTKRPPKQQPNKNAAQRLFEDLPDTAPQDWFAKLQSAGFVAQQTNVASLRPGQPQAIQTTNLDNLESRQWPDTATQTSPSANTTTQAVSLPNQPQNRQVISSQNPTMENSAVQNLAAQNLAAQNETPQHSQTINAAAPQQRLNPTNQTPSNQTPTLPTLKRPSKDTPKAPADLLEANQHARQNWGLNNEDNTTPNNSTPNASPLEPNTNTTANVVATEVYNPPNRRLATNQKPKTERAKTEAERLFEDLPDTAPQDWFAKLQSAGFVDTNTPALRQRPEATTGPNSNAQNPNGPSSSAPNSHNPNFGNPTNSTPPQTARVVQRNPEPLQTFFANPSNTPRRDAINQPNQTLQLSEQARRLLQPIVGIDPHTVRIERDPRSNALTRAANADALTIGDTIVLSPKLASETPTMLGVVAHELTHVAKARGARFVPAMLANPNGDEESLALQAESQTRMAAQYIQQATAAQTAPWQPNNTWAGKPGQAQPAAMRFVQSLPPSTATMPASMPSTPSSALQTLNALYAPQASSAPSRAAIQAAASDRAVPMPASAPTPAPNATLPTRAAEAPKDSAGTRETKPNLDALAQEVYQIIKRRLAAERRRS